MVDSTNRSVVHRWQARLVVCQSALVAGCSIGLSGCRGEQSALAPAGREAHQIAQLFWWMLGSATVVWLVMMGLGLYAIISRRRPHSERQTRLFVIMGGAVVPTALLTILLCFGLSMLPKLVARAPAGSLVIDVHGVQWWWRVLYPAPEGPATAAPTTGAPATEGRTFELANEICIPVDEAVEFRLHSEDVIHSFWIPSLGGKVDMIPGRTTRLVLHPTQTGIYRGACAEYCGSSHALMNFYVRVLSRHQFDEWLEGQRRNAQSPTGAAAQRGAALFLASGCGACHTLRGTSARGIVGPDLTHFGSRHSVGAAALPNNRESVRYWLRHTDHIKPQVEMPAFHVLDEQQLSDLSAYLEQLK